MRAKEGEYGVLEAERARSFKKELMGKYAECCQEVKRQDYQVFTEFSNSPGDLGKLRISRMVRMESRPQGLEWGVTDDKVGDPPQEIHYYLTHKSENQAFTR